MARLTTAGIGSVAANDPGVSGREQYAALAQLRWHMFVNSLRTTSGAFELGARVFMFLLYLSMGLGLGVGAYFSAFLLASSESWQFLPIPFWVACLIWQMVPIMLASLQEQFDLGILLRFPVRFRSYVLLYLIFGLSDVSSILGGILCFSLWLGITVAQPGFFAFTALAIALFALFNILLVRAIFAWIDRWLAQRKTREIIGACFMLLMLSFQFFNPALHNFGHHGHRSRIQKDQDINQALDLYMPAINRANAIQKWLPPGLATTAIFEAVHGQPMEAVEQLGLLGLYIAAAGGALALRLRSEYRGESLGQSPSRQQEKRHQGGWLLDGSGPIAAVIEKEIRTIMRSLPLLYAIGAPLLLVFVFATMFHNSDHGAAQGFALALPLALAYAMIGFTQLFYNNLGAEGPAVQILFLSPTPIRTVLLAKNIFHSAVFCLDAAVVCTLVILRLGWPTPAVLAATVAWLLFALPTHLASGNVFSLVMPYRVNLGRISRQRGSQGNALLSLLVQVVVLGLGAAVFGIAAFFNNMWIACPAFLLLACGAIFAWRRVLSNADSMANRRKDSLIATLVKAA